MNVLIVTHNLIWFTEKYLYVYCFLCISFDWTILLNWRNSMRDINVFYLSIVYRSVFVLLTNPKLFIFVYLALRKHKSKSLVIFVKLCLIKISVKKMNCIHKNHTRNMKERSFNLLNFDPVRSFFVYFLLTTCYLTLTKSHFNKNPLRRVLKAATAATKTTQWSMIWLIWIDYTCLYIF